MNGLIKHAAMALALGVWISAAAAAGGVVDPGLAGTTQYDGWDDLSASAHPGYPSFPGSGPWPQAIGSNAAGSGDAALEKLANGVGGGPFPAGDSIYFGGFSAEINADGGTLLIRDETPLEGIKTLVLQIQVGEAWTYDFVDGILPVLKYNDQPQPRMADSAVITERLFDGTVAMPTGEENLYINTYKLTWDLSQATEPVDSFVISWSGVQHSRLYELRLDQSDAVPEPTTLAMLLLGGAMLRRRRGGF